MKLRFEAGSRNYHQTSTYGPSGQKPPEPRLPPIEKATPQKPKRLMLHDEKISHIRHAIEDFGREYREHLAINRGSGDRLPLRLKKKARELFREGSGLEPLAEVTGRSVGVVRSWVDPHKPQKAAPQLDVELNEAEAEIPHPEPVSEHEDDRLQAEASTSAENQQTESGGSTKEAPSKDNSDWVRVRVGDVVMEISWQDLTKRMQKVEDKAPNLKLPEDLEISTDQDTEYHELIDNFEKLVLVNALKRHTTLGAAAWAMKLSRSTFDSRRKKFEL